jgi:uncharacterized protein (DUF2225 family)
VLCREGEPPGPAYIICEGRVRVYKRDLTRPDSTVDLAQLGTGDVIGELAPLLKQPRTATVQAIEPTQILEISVEQLGALLQSQAGLQRVIGAALQDRSGLEPERLATIAARLGVTLPEATAADGQRARTILPPPTFDPELAYAKHVECPACGAQFSALVPRTRKAQLAERSSDFHQLYGPPFNPSDYELWVCPVCLYTAFPSDFSELRPVHIAHVADVVERVVADWPARPDFNADRNLDLREKSLRLARALYQMRQAPAARDAALLHRLAWCARERGDEEQEQAWLTQALAAYTIAYNESDLAGAREELRILYLCGELRVRLGDLEGGLTWFSQAMRHEHLQEHAMWEGILRERYAAVRAGLSSAA